MGWNETKSPQKLTWGFLPISSPNLKNTPNQQQLTGKNSRRVFPLALKVVITQEFLALRGARRRMGVVFFFESGQRRPLVGWTLPWFYWWVYISQNLTEWRFSNIFLGMFTPKIGEDDSQFDSHIFQMGWNHQLEMFLFIPENWGRCPIFGDEQKHLWVATPSYT